MRPWIITRETAERSAGETFSMKRRSPDMPSMLRWDGSAEGI